MSAVIGIVFNANKDQVLILKRRDVAVWVFPGGGIDPGETPEAAVQREVLEETGFHVSVVKKVGEYSPLNRLSRYTYVFECHLISGQAMIGAETREIRFHPLNSLPKTFFFYSLRLVARCPKKSATVDFKANSSSHILKLV